LNSQATDNNTALSLAKRHTLRQSSLIKEMKTYLKFIKTKIPIARLRNQTSRPTSSKLRKSWIGWGSQLPTQKLTIPLKAHQEVKARVAPQVALGFFLQGPLTQSRRMRSWNSSNLSRDKGLNGILSVASTKRSWIGHKLRFLVTFD